MALCDDVLLLAGGRVEYRGVPAGLFVPVTDTRYRLTPSVIVPGREMID